MDFLKKRVRQYQEKKLTDALSKVKFHLDMKKQLEKQSDASENSKAIDKEITYHDKMITIWKNNAEKIKNEMKKID